MTPSTKREFQTLILCGGKGERLRPFTDALPKPLVPIRNKPIIEYIVNQLEGCGVREILVAAGYKADKLADYFCSQTRVRAKVADSGDVDIIARIRAFRTDITQDLLLLYGDTISDVDVDALVEFHAQNRGRATVTLWQLRSPFGVLEIGPDNLVASYEEKPMLDKWINIGYFYFDRDILGWLDDFESFQDLLSSLVERQELNGFRHDGIHITVNTVEELKMAQRDVVQLGAASRKERTDTRGGSAIEI